MKTKTTKYLLGELVKGWKYQDIGHQPGGIIWWICRGKFRKIQSKGKMKDFHVYLVREADKTEADYVWRGRYSSEGIASILPPVKIYCTPEISLPRKILDMVYANLRPKILLIDTPKGLRKVVKQNKMET